MKKESYERKGTPLNHTLDMENIPKDVILGVPIVMVTGNFEVIIENYRGILEYTDRIIRIRRKGGEIVISGDKLEVSYYKNNDMKVIGQIKCIAYS